MNFTHFSRLNATLSCLDLNLVATKCVSSFIAIPCFILEYY